MKKRIMQGLYVVAALSSFMALPIVANMNHLYSFWAGGIAGAFIAWLYVWLSICTHQKQMAKGWNILLKDLTIKLKEEIRQQAKCVEVVDGCLESIRNVKAEKERRQ